MARTRRQRSTDASYRQRRQDTQRARELSRDHADAADILAARLARGRHEFTGTGMPR